jgi:Tfp pilus assembly PilM family ATPase
MGKLGEKEGAEAKAALGSFVRERGYKRAHVIVHEGESYVFCVTVKTTERRELRSAIEAVLEENVPIPPAEAVFEYEVIDVDRVRGETRVAVSVVSEKTLSNYVDVFKSAGLSPVSFETEARALARALFLPQDRATRVVVSVGRNHSMVFITKGSAVVFSSAIEIGSFDIEAQIAGVFGISADDAQALKEQKGFTGESEDRELFAAMSPAFSTVRDELDKVVSYWRGQGRRGADVEEISEIVLCGRDGALLGFSRYLSTPSRLHVRLGSVWTGLVLPKTIVPDIPFNDSLDYGAVIGGLV